MGEYNPHAPQILGQEWVPIRDEDVTFSPAVNVVELGHGFTLTGSKTLTEGRYYINTLPPSEISNQVYSISVYPQGEEALTGPVRSVLIPCNAGAVTGTFLGGTSDIPTSLFRPNDSSAISVEPSATITSKELNVWFAVNAYANLLAGKRIVGVNLLHQLAWDPIDGSTGEVAAVDVAMGTTQALAIKASGLASTSLLEFSPAISIGGPRILALNPQVGRLSQVRTVQRVRLGESNRFWAPSVATTTSESLPWRYEELQRFEVSAGVNRLSIYYDFGGTDDWAGTYYLGYAALEVLFCEETRVAVGGFRYTGSANQYRYGANLITMRDLALAANPVLTAGAYVATVSSPDIGDVRGAGAVGRTQPAAQNTYPAINGLRELYSIPPHPGVQVNVTQTVGEAFSSEDTVVLPQLSLHTSSGPVTEVHAYGRQAVAQVYGSLTATQDIDDGLAGGAYSYPWVRFYARRWGDTTVPLTLDSPSIAGSSVTITPAEFDALDEITDGWKAVTLRFDTPPTMGTGTRPQWRWSAAGESAGNRWEILGATAPALSGIPGNLLNLAPAPNQLSIATYGQPASGAAVNLGWIPQYAPPVTATADDQTSDAAILFARDLPAVTGFSVVQSNQEIVGIGLDCGLDPCCIPSSITYHTITWSPTAENPSTILDDFDRTLVSQWGNTTTGEPWSITQGAATQFWVDPGEGIHSVEALNARRGTVLTTVNFTDVSMRFNVLVPTTPLTQPITFSAYMRYVDTDNHYYLRSKITTASAVEVSIIRRLLGVETTVVSATTVTALTHSTSVPLAVVTEAVGTTLRMRVWLSTEDEPVGVWHASGVDSGIASGAVGFRTLIDAGNTNPLPVNIEFSNVVITPVVDYFGYYELQRSDDIDTDWATIMKGTAITGASFNDYEARVGIETSYRIRAVDLYEFPGPWSDTVSITMPTPGVTGGSCFDAGGHVLIFTSNERQDGSANLAYSSVWEGRVQEDFDFPEAQFVQLQAMYDRDFFTAFRPSERGGDQFSRTVLVQAAAISAPTLDGFTSLTDMAWADTSYICVRDEDGNKWLATVIVPAGRVTFQRRLYMAEVRVIEVTATPSPVDPWS